MTAYHVGQAIFSCLVVALVVERARTLLWRAPLEPAAFRVALLRLLRDGERDRARDLVSDARPSWVALVLWPLLDPSVPDAERHVEANDLLLDVESRVTRRLRALRMSASIASAGGFIGAGIEMYWVFAMPHGLLGLQAGLVESIGLSRAVLAIG